MATKTTENLKGAVERPESAKARILDDDAIDAMLAERERQQKAEDKAQAAKEGET